MPEWYDDWKESPPEAEAACVCDCCGRSLYEGDYLYTIDGEHLCEDCVNDEYRKMI